MKNKMPFQGTFLDNCIEDANAISSCTVCLGWCHGASKIYVAMAQLLKYNCYAKCREEAIISTVENFQKTRNFFSPNTPSFFIAPNL